MLPEIKDGQSIWIEITNPIHGGKGWEFGTCLWSPVNNKGGKDTSWKIMKGISPQDIVLNFRKTKVNGKKEYFWVGVSTVESNLRVFVDSPPIPGKWANMSPYQKINLTNYRSLSNPVRIKDIYTNYDLELKQILKSYILWAYYFFS